MAQDEDAPRIGLLLAAGHSRRFGAADKLLAPLEGAPLVTHAASALRAAAPDRLIAVVRSAKVAACLPEFETVALSDRDAPQSASLRAGVLRAAELGAAGVLVALGDMPRVPAVHFSALFELGRTQALAATQCGARTMPPAWFADRYFGALADVSGDKGARDLLRRTPMAARIACPPEWLADIDRPEDLSRVPPEGS
ncbi:MAG: nucleotidyltransferase family protein [Rhodobacteraceae bacterium]|nr:nucleotidyltransferase family protein [Paracoccaceae bacterium]